MNLIEEFIVNNIPLKTWKRACLASPEALDVCGALLTAAGLIEFGMDVGTGSEAAADYATAFFDASRQFEKETA